MTPDYSSDSADYDPLWDEDTQPRIDIENDLAMRMSYNAYRLTKDMRVVYAIPPEEEVYHKNPPEVPHPTLKGGV